MSTVSQTTMGEGRSLSSWSWGGGSSLGLDEKHQPDVTTVRSLVLDQVVTSE